MNGSTVEEALTMVQQYIQELEDEIEGTRKREEQVPKPVPDWAKAKIERQRTELNDALLAKADLRGQLTKTQDRYEARNRALNDADAQIVELRTQLKKVNGRLIKAQDQLMEVMARQEHLQNTVRLKESVINSLRKQVHELENPEPERTCPSPGGCASCPNTTWCTVLRLNSALTTIEEEVKFLQDSGQNGVYDGVKFVDRNTPMEEFNEEG